RSPALMALMRLSKIFCVAASAFGACPPCAETMVGDIAATAKKAAHNAGGTNIFIVVLLKVRLVVGKWRESSLLENAEGDYRFPVSDFKRQIDCSYHS